MLVGEGRRLAEFSGPRVCLVDIPGLWRGVGLVPKPDDEKAF